MVSEYSAHNFYYQLTANLDVFLTHGGNLWRISSGYRQLPAVNDYYTVSFTTPATGDSLYVSAGIEKSGNEILASLIEGGTYVAGTAASTPLINLNRTIGDANPPIVAYFGSSLASGGTSTTITGGTTILDRLIPGTGTPAVKASGSVSDGGYIDLKANTRYTLKVMGLSTNTTVLFYFNFGYNF